MTKVFSMGVVGLAIAIGFFVAPARSSSPQKKTDFENIKVMNALSDSEIMGAMRQWQDDLGTNCSHCHAGTDFASEDNPKKQTARVMFKMLTTINKDFLNGKASCALCHRGSTTPPDPDK
jgi:hypothetical protein